MFGVFSNPKCLKVKNGIAFESARFADSLPTTTRRTLAVMEGVASPDGDQMPGDMS